MSAVCDQTCGFASSNHFRGIGRRSLRPPLCLTLWSLFMAKQVQIIIIIIIFLSFFRYFQTSLEVIIIIIIINIIIIIIIKNNGSL